MALSNFKENKSKHSFLNTVIAFVAVNCIIVSVLTFVLTSIAVITSNYDKWFPVAVILSVLFFFIGRWLIHNRHRF
uniref:hypothetical protein n=1 Tax=Ningiella ruwaisensis TaxID=2364274 RepID=UPI0010A041CC|nr:hypothetical protein [Ningiella ruwaisensis]